jgi:hypothetical protein
MLRVRGRGKAGDRVPIMLWQNLCQSAGLALLLCGCPNPNTYTVPRTLDPGEMQATLSPELFAYHYTSNTRSLTGVTPTAPSFGMRYGLSDGVELGGRLSSMASPVVDAKIRLVRGVVDVAIDPGAQLLYLYVNGSSETEFLLHLYGPVLVGINLSPSVTLVASPGVGYGLATSRLDTSTSPAEIAAGATGFTGRIGFGVDIRTGRRSAVHPEITVMRVFDGAQTIMGVLGLGLNMGAMPDYSDLEPQQ